jgi:hypothetical protein
VNFQKIRVGSLVLSNVREGWPGRVARKTRESLFLLSADEREKIETTRAERDTFFHSFIRRFVSEVVRWTRPDGARLFSCFFYLDDVHVYKPSSLQLLR